MLGYTLQNVVFVVLVTIYQVVCWLVDGWDSTFEEGLV
jgi:hypothetical protein